MFIDIRDIPEGHTVIEQSVTMTEEQIRDGGFIGNVFCRAKIERLQFQIFLHVSYACKVSQECSRCLNTFEYPVEGTCDIIFQDRGATGSMETDDAEFFDYCFSERETIIDIRQSLYEEVMINLPIKPLCKYDCPGVVECKKNDSDGSNLEETIDPRWETLKKIRENMENT